MKTAIYIEDGTVQLVITPETDFEKNALSSFEARPLEAEIFAGSFYDCRGGWVLYTHNSHNTEDRSLILRVRKPAHEPAPEKSAQSAQSADNPPAQTLTQ